MALGFWDANWKRSSSISKVHVKLLHVTGECSFIFLEYSYSLHILWVSLIRAHKHQAQRAVSVTNTKPTQITSSDKWGKVLTACGLFHSLHFFNSHYWFLFILLHALNAVYRICNNIHLFPSLPSSDCEVWWEAERWTVGSVGRFPLFCKSTHTHVCLRESLPYSGYNWQFSVYKWMVPTRGKLVIMLPMFKNNSRGKHSYI